MNVRKNVEHTSMLCLSCVAQQSNVNQVWRTDTTRPVVSLSLSLHKKTAQGQDGRSQDLLTAPTVTELHGKFNFGGRTARNCFLSLAPRVDTHPPLPDAHTATSQNRAKVHDTRFRIKKRTAPQEFRTEKSSAFQHATLGTLWSRFSAQPRCLLQPGFWTWSPWSWRFPPSHSSSASGWWFRSSTRDFRTLQLSALPPRLFSLPSLARVSQLAWWDSPCSSPARHQLQTATDWQRTRNRNADRPIMIALYPLTTASFVQTRNLSLKWRKGQNNELHNEDHNTDRTQFSPLSPTPRKYREKQQKNDNLVSTNHQKCLKNKAKTTNSC